MVDVSSSKNSITITVGNTNKNNPVSITPSTANNSVTTKSDTAQYWSNLSRDYSEQAKTSAYKAEQVKNEIITQKDIIIADIENTGVNAVGNIATIKSESIADIEAKTNEASELIDTSIEDTITTLYQRMDQNYYYRSTKTGASFGDLAEDFDYLRQVKVSDLFSLASVNNVCLCNIIIACLDEN